MKRFLKFLGKDDPDFTYDAKSFGKDLRATFVSYMIAGFGYLGFKHYPSFELKIVITIGVLTFIVGIINMTIGTILTFKKRKRHEP